MKNKLSEEYKNPLAALAWEWNGTGTGEGEGNLSTATVTTVIGFNTFSKHDKTFLDPLYICF